MSNAHAIQSQGRRAVDLLAKLYADRPAEFGWLSEDMTILRRCIDDERFQVLAADKIREVEQCGS